MIKFQTNIFNKIFLLMLLLKVQNKDVGFYTILFWILHTENPKKSDLYHPPERSKAKVIKVPCLCSFWPLFYDFLVSSTTVSTWHDIFWLMSDFVHLLSKRKQVRSFWKCTFTVATRCNHFNVQIFTEFFYLCICISSFSHKNNLRKRHQNCHGSVLLTEIILQKAPLLFIYLNL